LLQASTGAPQQKPVNACLFCQARVATRLAGWGMPFRWLSQWLVQDDRRAAARWVQQLRPADYPAALFQSWPIGKWMKSSVHKHFRHNVLDLSDPTVASVYGSYLYSGVIAALALNRIFEEERPSVQLLFNGRMGPTRIALELAKLHGVRTICEERAYPIGRMMLFENTNCLDFSAFAALWDQWQAIPMVADECEETADFFSGRWLGKSPDITVFSSKLNASAQILSDLGLDSGRPTLALFTSSLDEATDLEPINEPFQNQYDWIDETIKYVAANPGIQLVIRVHPNAGSTRSFGANAQDLAYFEALPHRLPPNAKLIPSASKVSSYDLAAAAIGGLVWRSTIGLEMAAMGRHVIRAAHGPMAFANIIDGPSTPQLYSESLKRLLSRTSKFDLGTAIQAWRFAYAFYFRWSKPFPLVRQPNWYTGELGYNSAADLGPGRDAALDDICDVFLSRRALHQPPIPRSAALMGAESAFVNSAVAGLLGQPT
jgi:hypothetical protein